MATLLRSRLPNCDGLRVAAKRGGFRLDGLGTEGGKRRKNRECCFPGQAASPSKARLKCNRPRQGDTRTSTRARWRWDAETDAGDGSGHRRWCDRIDGDEVARRRRDNGEEKSSGWRKKVRGRQKAPTPPWRQLPAGRHVTFPIGRQHARHLSRQEQGAARAAQCGSLGMHGVCDRSWRSSCIPQSLTTTANGAAAGGPGHTVRKLYSPYLACSGLSLSSPLKKLGLEHGQWTGSRASTIVHPGNGGQAAQQLGSPGSCHKHRSHAQGAPAKSPRI